MAEQGMYVGRQQLQGADCVLAHHVVVPMQKVGKMKHLRDSNLKTYLAILPVSSKFPSFSRL
jgi:hypothetical protein